MLNLFIHRESDVPIQDQLVAQVGQLVASGALPSGQKLPSVRGMADRLGIHPQTVLAAYRTLAERGVLTITRGSGVKVSEFSATQGTWREGVALSAMAAYFVAQARARGHDDPAILAACSRALAPAPIQRLVVVNPHPDLQRIYARELSRAVACPVTGVTPEEVVARGPDGFPDACLLTSTNFATRLNEMVRPDQPRVFFRLASTDPLIAIARSLRPDQMMALVSSSERFLFLFRELLSTVLSSDQLVTFELGKDGVPPGVPSMAATILTDVESFEKLSPKMKAKARVHHLLAADFAADLAGILPPESFRP